ncbi:Ig-like domain-containing protein [Roseinatronobacter monicus]|uniref:Ig-like domain-containing protein n=1 Tax=Roseinatronobacter monicus TaxID=393481 RepID=A0A543K959_9RHOB|nr:Ig-like domain-containing protein [Roseinatronobacter monicus]TQM91582.1 hypothetical protein BD293_0146 [Roseinatronobacter monicus]
MNEHSPVLTTSLRADMDPATRRAYVQKWIARNQRRVSAGLGATVLTLPLLAQAQSAEGLVNVLDIAGVRSVALNADGSAQLTLGNGQQVQVAASSVQLAADGSVMISAAAAELVAEVVAGTAVSGAAGAGGGIGGAGIAAAVGGLGLAAAAAGGGGGSSANDSAPAIPVLNASAITPTSLQNVTAVFGSLPELGPEDSLFLKIGDGDEVKVTIGEDGSLNFPSAIDLAQFQGQQTLSYRVERTSTVEGEDDEGNPTSDTVTEDVASGSAVVFIDTIAPEITITTPIAGDDVINAAEKGEGIVIEGTAEGAENGQIVTLTLNGTEFTATVTDAAWSVPITAADLTALGLVSGVPVEITANVADAAGNPAKQDEATVGTDFIAEIRIDPVVIETLNTFIGVTVKGDTTGVEADRPITVTFNGQNIPGVVVQADGSWSANVPASVIKALDDGADITISASVSDRANNSDTSATTVTTDFSTPPVAITSPATGGFINEEAAGQQLVVEGVSLPGADVTVTLTGGATRDIQADDEGRWETSFDPEDLPENEGDFIISATSLIDGVPVPVPAQDVTLTKDTIAPDAPDLELAQDTGTVAGETSNGQVNITNLEDGASAEYSVDGGANWTPVEGASFTLTGDGVKSVTVRQTDLANNQSDPSAALEFKLDTAPPEVTVTSLAGIAPDGTLTANELYDDSGEPLATVVLTGTATGAVDGAPVTVLIDGTALVLNPAPTVTDEVWSVDIPVTELAGLETIEVRTVDGAGNEGTGAAGFINAVVIPSITITNPTKGFVIGLDEFENGFTISGTTTDVPDGQNVTITFVDKNDAENRFTDSAQVENGVWSLNIEPSDVQRASDQTDWELTVSVSDGSFPVPATAEISVSSNFPPEITFNPLGEDGALILADIAESGEITLSGTTRGVQKNQEVTLFVGNGDDIKNQLFGNPEQNPTVDENGDWTVTFTPNISGFVAGQEIVFSAEVTNASDRKAEVSETVVTYQASNLTVFNTGQTGNTLDFAVDVNLDEIGGRIFQASFDVFVDPSLGSIVSVPIEDIEIAGALNPFRNAGSHPDFVIGDRVENNIEAGLINVLLFNLSTLTDLREIPLYTFQFEINDGANGVVEVRIPNTVPAGATFDASALAERMVINADSAEFEREIGPLVSYTGTNGNDEIVAANVDTVIRGRDGDDQIDVSAPGVNTIIFEGGSVANGFDTITGFTLEGALADRFAFAFDMFDQDLLRGDGTDFQVSNSDGEALGDNVGLLVFTTAVTNLDDNSEIAAIVQNALSGWENNDALYLLIGDGENARLTSIGFDGSDVSVTAENSAKTYAEFKGIGDLSGFSSANIIGFEQYNT